MAGTLPERDGDSLYNTCYVFEDGWFLGKHRKYHLFNIDIEGGISFHESRVFTAGSRVTTIDTGYGKIGVAICFDIRFPELFKLMALEGARIIFMPGAFNHVTGPLHWEISLRARAIDSQCFVIGCSPALNSDASYKAWGHSAVVDPMGNVVTMLDSEAGMIVEDIDLEEVERTRRQLPLLSQTRLLQR